MGFRMDLQAFWLVYLGEGATPGLYQREGNPHSVEQHQQRGVMHLPGSRQCRKEQQITQVAALLKGASHAHSLRRRESVGLWQVTPVLQARVSGKLSRAFL